MLHRTLLAFTILSLFAFEAVNANIDSLEPRSKIRSLEPPNWWAGMVSNELQLMVYGNGVGEMSVRSTSDKVEVVSAHSLDNNRYLFVDLRLSDNLPAGFVDLIFTGTQGREAVYPFEFKPRVKASSQREGFSSKDVIYLVTPDRFANGDETNDNVEGLTEQLDRSNPDGRHGGDLAGLENHLEYLQALGITKVWLNPLQQNNEEKYSYHGYSISDLYQIDARYGGNQALLSFSAKAQERGIGLIMDSIPNHIGLNHWWMRDLPAKNWINNGGEFTQTSHNHEAIQDPYASALGRQEFNDGWFVPTMPDLNQNVPELATYLIQNNIWWIEMANLAGLRVDTLPYADKHFTAQFSQRILQEYPNLNIVGEEWSTNPAVVSYWQAGKKNLDNFDAGVPSLMDFPLQEALVNALLETEADRTGVRRLHTMLANDFQYPEPNNLVVIGDNHDMSRLYTQLNEDVDLTKMALTFLMTTRGIPQLFYGTEILMSNKGTDAHGVIRSDFPGGWAGDKVNAKTGDGLAPNARETQQFVKTLLNWRKSATAIHSGGLTHYLPKSGVYTYFRYDAQSTVMVMMNKTERPVGVATARFAERIQNKTSKRDIFTGETTKISDEIIIAPKTALVFELH